MFDTPRFDNPKVRGLYTSLSDGWVYLNAVTAPQLPEKVSGAVARAFRTAPLAAPMTETGGAYGNTSNPGTLFGESYIQSARAAVADLVGGTPEQVIFGGSRKQLVGQLAEALSRRLSLGREVVLSRVDDEANIDPWLRAADLYGATVRWAEADLATGVLPAWQYTGLIGPDTSVVTVATANQHLGTVTDIAAIGRAVRTRSDAVFIVDVNATAPFRLLDVEELDADIVTLDLATIGGPSLGVLVFRSVDFMGDLFPQAPRKLRGRPGDLRSSHRGKKSPGELTYYSPTGYAAISQGVGASGTAAVRPEEDVPYAVRCAREWLEFDGLNEGLLGGVPATVDHLAELASDSDGESLPGSRRLRLLYGLPLAEDYVHGLARMVADGLHGLPGVHVIGLEGEYEAQFDYDSVERIPRLSFFIDGVPAEVVYDRLFAQGVVTSVIPPGSSELLEQMGVFESSTGAVCVGLSVHNTVGDVNRLLRAVASLR